MYTTRKVGESNITQVCIGPSILNSDLSNLNAECAKLLKAGADYLHLDVMDGHFVPNLTFGPAVVASLRKCLSREVVFDVHMMVTHPERWVSSMAEAGATIYTFHAEACHDARSLINDIKLKNMKAGIAISPDTPYSIVEGVTDVVDVLLVMTVEPGYGGQEMMVEMLDKVRLARKCNPNLDIEVDGGINLYNIDACVEAGANMIVSGSGIVKQKDPEAVINFMRERGNKILMAKHAKLHKQ